MFFSKVVLFTLSLGVFSVLATPHALQHHALHRRAVAARAVAARVASVPSFIANSSDVTVKRRQTSAKCIDRSQNPSSSSSSIPAVTPVAPTPVVPPVQNTPPVTPKPSPTTTPHQQPAPTTTSTPPSTQPPTTPPSGDDGPFTDGDGTFFATGLGACGITNVDTDYIVAVSEIRFDAVSTGNPNTNPLCGKKVKISFGGATATATIVDRCTGCGKDSLDMTTTLFQVFSPLGVGRIHGIVWSFI